MVPKDQVPRLRMKLAEAGLPKGGGVGYEIFDKSDALGATSFVQNINHLRALEGELARTIRAHRPRAGGARPPRSARAAAVLARQGRALGLDRAQGARRARAAAGARHPPPRRSAVNGLKPERVSVVDETGRLLADGAADESPAASPPTSASSPSNGACASRSRSIVTSVVGPGRARVQLTAEFDFNRVTQTSDKFDPEGRVVRSSQTREEMTSRPADATRRPGHGRQRIARRAAPATPTSAAARDQNRKTEEIVNYEISRTTKTEVIEGGRVNRISVAVLVDGTYAKNDKGEIAYQPRAKEEIDRIAALVRSAIGFDQKRGDQVEVVNLRLRRSAAAIPISEPPGCVRASCNSPRTTSCAASSSA